MQAAPQHWWSPAPAPDLPPISAKRAYGEVLFVFASFFLVGIIGAALLLANHYKSLEPSGSWALYITQAVDILISVGIALALVILFGERRGVTLGTLGVRMPRRPDGRVAAGLLTRIFAWGIFAQVLGGVINAALQTGHLPTQKATAPELVFAVADSINAGIVEEFVVLAFVVVTLRQARRPLWEVTVVALVLRCSYHIYYGPGVVGILVWAAIFYWLYLRFQCLVPLVICHAAWDTVSFLSQRWSFMAGIGLVIALGLWVAGPVTWLVERSDRKSAAVVWPVSTLQPTAPPGWHPDPSGANQWRWWDGYQWTEHVSAPPAPASWADKGS